MTEVIAPFRGQKIVEPLRGEQVPTQIMSEWMELASRVLDDLQLAEGAGSPEGVLVAKTNKLYRDTAGIAGAILYIKTTDSGDTGWILV